MTGSVAGLVALVRDGFRAAVARFGVSAAELAASQRPVCDPQVGREHNEGNVPEMFDATETLDSANTVTSNAAAVLRGLIDAGESGAEILFDRLRPMAEQLDALFGDETDPVPAPPTGGVPADAPAGSDSDAARQVGVTTQ